MREINKIIVHCSATQEGRDLDAANGLLKTLEHQNKKKVYYCY